MKSNRWFSKYGDRFISLPSTIKALGLEYEIMEVK